MIFLLRCAQRKQGLGFSSLLMTALAAILNLILTEALIPGLNLARTRDGDEEDDDDDEMKYRSGGSQLKEITVDVGPLGIKLINDPSGMCSDISEHELRQLRTDSSLRYIFNTTVGTVTVLSCTGQAQVKGVEAGDAVFEIQGQRILRGAEHPSVAATIKSMPRPFQMSFLPPGAPDPDTIGASSTLDEESQRDGQQVPGAEQAVESRTAGSGMPPAKERQALYREIQVTFGPGPMGIDLRTIDGSDHLVKALLGGKFGGANPPVIAVKRTIGQAQTLGLKTLDIIVTVNTQPVTPGTSSCGSQNNDRRSAKTNNNWRSSTDAWPS